MREAIFGGLLALLVACTAPDEKRDIVYDTRFGGTTSMDVYLPDDEGTRRPAVLFVHGGSWRAGSKEHFEDAGRRLARSGYVVASVNYRLLPHGVFPRNAHDCICAYAYLRAHAEDYGVDPDRIVVMGYSAGAHLAGLVGVASDHPEMIPDCDAAGGRATPLPKGVIAAAGTQDFRLLWASMDDKKFVEEIMGGSPAEISF
jgi:acetyl esterase/lipase